MTSGSFVPLAGSERTAISGVQDLGPVNEQERIEVTVVLRRRAELPDELVFSPEVISQSELADAYGAEQADVELVRETLSGLGLEITATDEASRQAQGRGHRGRPDPGVRHEPAPGPQYQARGFR